MSEEQSGMPQPDERTSTFRVLARQPLSLDIGRGVQELDIQNVTCRIAVTPDHSDLAKRKELGGIGWPQFSSPSATMWEASSSSFGCAHTRGRTFRIFPLSALTWRLALPPEAAADSARGRSQVRESCPTPASSATGTLLGF
jgi:hypothetical protein